MDVTCFIAVSEPYFVWQEPINSAPLSKRISLPQSSPQKDALSRFLLGRNLSCTVGMGNLNQKKEMIGLEEEDQLALF